MVTATSGKLNMSIQEINQNFCPAYEGSYQEYMDLKPEVGGMVVVYGTRKRQQAGDSMRYRFPVHVDVDRHA